MSLAVTMLGESATFTHPLTYRLTISELRDEHQHHSPRLRSCSPRNRVDDHIHYPSSHPGAIGSSSRPTVQSDGSVALQQGSITSPIASQFHLETPMAQHLPAISNDQTTSPRYEALSTTYPKPHDRPLPSNDQALLHLPSDLGVSFFAHNPTGSPLAQQAQPRMSLVRIDRSILPVERHVRRLLHHFETYTSAAFPIFHIPSLQEWVDQVCFRGEPVESEVACAVLRE